MNLSATILASIHGIIAQARDRAIRSVDTERVRMYWQYWPNHLRGGAARRKPGGVRGISDQRLGRSIAAAVWQRVFGKAAALVRAVLPRFPEYERAAFTIISLPENNQTIMASKYQLYLPTAQQLIEEMKQEMDKLDNS